jgi:hypothetical protein
MTCISSLEQASQTALGAALLASAIIVPAMHSTHRDDPTAAGRYFTGLELLDDQLATVGSLSVLLVALFLLGLHAHDLTLQRLKHLT